MQSPVACESGKGTSSMSKRYEERDPDCDLEIISPAGAEDAGLDALNEGDYALVIGDPWAGAPAVIGSPAGLRWFARRVQDAVLGLPEAGPGTPAGHAAAGVSPAPLVRPVQPARATGTCETPGQTQTPADLAANATAAFDPGTDPARSEDGDHSLYPAVTIGGAIVFAYAENGVLTVSVDLDDALLRGESPVWAAYGPPGGRLVPVRVIVQGTEVFRAVQGEEPIPAGRQDHDGQPRL